ncbi:hypothetical protein RAS2_09500 [Phycisphaerae bacterium RAS2]|nr:hypothetical protein RAS2_09500 [Phycisphaerae bacterium RAS2]
MSNKSLVTATLIVVLSLSGLIPARGQTPAQDGQWSTPFSLPLIAIHSAVLPTGKVLMFSAEHGVPGIHAWLFDPASILGTPVLTNVPPPTGWNPDCAGHSFLPDGRLLVAGGTLQFNPLLGSKLAYLFDPWIEQWIQVEDMRAGRWYPTNVTLPDGRVVTMSGINDTDGGLNPDIELWDVNGANNWELLGQKYIPYYPYLHVLPSGLVFRSGPDSQTETFNPATSIWTPVDGTNASARFEAPSVLLPPTLNRVMLIGGYTGGSSLPTNSAEIIDFSTGTPTWTLTAHMGFRRMEFNAVILPTQKVLVVGGKASADGSPDQPVLTPEIFDPANPSWDQVAPHQIPRMYHSTAILLPDARVLAAGGDFQPTGEIYSPPYLFQGLRPTITSAPGWIAYGSNFALGFTSATGNNRVALISLSSVTHSVNMGQRYVLLAQGLAAGGAVSVPAPASGYLAPPGYYMLFVVNANGVPSVSQIVRVGERIPGDLNCDGMVNASDQSPFVNALLDPAGFSGCAILNADMNGDTLIDGQDIPGFVAALL